VFLKSFSVEVSHYLRMCLNNLIKAESKASSIHISWNIKSILEIHRQVHLINGFMYLLAEPLHLSDMSQIHNA
jgi:hypothetical protein